ncbi:MAG: ABC transporter permease [Clostridia bacterium]|nr:ABC transporter permease [Clostridia bacterium]MBQ7788628.1 ABC transporter permease [Clostridia bacterium]
MEKINGSNPSPFKEWMQRKKESIRKNTNIVRELVKKNIKVQYRNSIIGALWTILNPLLNMLVMYFVFSGLFGKDDKTYALYLLCAQITFTAMRTATTQSLPSIVRNRGLLTKNKISEYVFPISCNISAIINFLFSFVALLGVMVWVTFSQGVQVFSWSILMTLIMLPALFLFNLGMSFILTTMYVYFRDIMHFYNVFLTLWTYLTPMFYKPDTLLKGMGPVAKWLIEFTFEINPMYHFVEYFRDIIYRSVGNPVLFPDVGRTLGIYGIGILFFGIGILIFSLTRKKFIYNI